MRTKIAIVIATVALCSFIAFALAANWYYSLDRQTTIVDYAVTLNNIAAQTTRYSNITMIGQATLGGSALPGITVTLFLNGNPVGTNLTDVNGNYRFSYNATDPAGTLYTFRAGINQ
jgi:hypothetical protein